MLSLLGTALFGLIVGALAKLVMPGRDPGGILVTMLLDMTGSLVGGFVGRMLGLYGANDSAGFIMVTTIIIEFVLGMILDDVDYIYFVETVWTAIICMGGAAVGGLLIATLMSKKVIDGFTYKPD